MLKTSLLQKGWFVGALLLLPSIAFGMRRHAPQSNMTGRNETVSLQNLKEECLEKRCVLQKIVDVTREPLVQFKRQVLAANCCGAVGFGLMRYFGDSVPLWGKCCVAVPAIAALGMANLLRYKSENGHKNAQYLLNHGERIEGIDPERLNERDECLKFPWLNGLMGLSPEQQDLYVKCPQYDEYYKAISNYEYQLGERAREIWNGEVPHLFDGKDDFSLKIQALGDICRPLGESVDAAGESVDAAGE